jgi:hypothetical protein
MDYLDCRDPLGVVGVRPRWHNMVYRIPTGWHSTKACLLLSQSAVNPPPSVWWSPIMLDRAGAYENQGTRCIKPCLHLSWRFHQVCSTDATLLGCARDVRSRCIESYLVLPRSLCTLLIRNFGNRLTKWQACRTFYLLEQTSLNSASQVL